MAKAAFAATKLGTKMGISVSHCLLGEFAERLVELEESNSDKSSSCFLLCRVTACHWEKEVHKEVPFHTLVMLQSKIWNLLVRIVGFFVVLCGF